MLFKNIDNTKNQAYFFIAEDQLLMVFVGSWLGTEKSIFEDIGIFLLMISSLICFCIFLGILRKSIFEESDKGFLRCCVIIALFISFFLVFFSNIITSINNFNTIFLYVMYSFWFIFSLIIGFIRKNS